MPIKSSPLLLLIATLLAGQPATAEPIATSVMGADLSPPPSTEPTAEPDALPAETAQATGPEFPAPDFSTGELPTVIPPALLSPVLTAPLHSDGNGLDSEQFDSHFRQVLDAAAIPGGAYAIVKDGQILRASGHGLRSSVGVEPVTDSTVFRIASVSKTFAAELTALLVREGKLRWEDRVSAFVPQLQLKSANHLQLLQIQHLLGQSSGIVSNAYDNLLDANMPLPKILPRFRELKPICQPGQCYSYQNILFSLIEPAIERVTRQPYSSLVQHRFFDPLKMHNASVGIQAFLATPNRALPHIKRKGLWVQTEVQSGYYEVPPAAGVNASANDLGKWLLAQMGSNPDVVPPQIVEQLTAKRVRTLRDMRRKAWRGQLTDAHYGLGWRIYQIGKEEIYLHSGWVKGYVAEVAYSKTHRTGLVVLLNAESGAINDITTAFWAAVLRSDKPVPLALAE